MHTFFQISIIFNIKIYFNDSHQYCSQDKSIDQGNASSSEVLSSPESCSLPRRLGVKMGTRAFNGFNQTAYQHKQFHSLDATHIG